MNSKALWWKLLAALALMTTGAACAGQSGSLGGAALPQEAPSNVDAPADGASPQDVLTATDGLSMTAPVAVPYQSNDAADSRLVNPWQGWLDEATAPVDAPPSNANVDADMVAPADAPGAIDAASAGSADIAAAEGPIRRSILPSTGSPEACKAMLLPLSDAIGTGKQVEVALTTIPADGRYVSRATGSATRTLRPSAPSVGPRYSLDAAMVQLFSDRTYDRPRVLTPGGPQCRAPCTMPQGYDAARPDQLFMQIEALSGETTLILRSWGDSTVLLKPSCEAGMMWGYGGGMFYVATLQVVKSVKRE